VFLYAAFAQTLPERATQQMAAGLFDQAEVSYRELIKQMPANPGWKLNLGIALHMQSKDAEAVPPLEVAARAMPSSFPAHALLGTSLMRLGQPSKALGPLQKAVALQPKDAQGRRILADAFLQLNQPRNAVAQLGVLTQLEPLDPGAWYVLGRANESAAAQVFEELRKLDPESKAFLLTLARVRRQQSRLKAADALEEQARGRVANVKADALARQIEIYNDGARRAFAQLGGLPDNPQIHKVKAETLRANGKHAEAVEEWRAVLQFTPRDRDVERELAASLYSANQFLEALNTLNRLLVHDPDSAELHFLKGDCLLLQGNPEEALEPLTEAVKRRQTLLEARASLARALIAVGRGTEAVPHLEVSAPALDTDGSLHFQLSRAYQAAGLAEKAAAALKRSQELRAEGR
jgi:predicted Zn-dependent protease